METKNDINKIKEAFINHILSYTDKLLEIDIG